MGVAGKYNKVVGSFIIETPKDISYMKPAEAVGIYGIDKVYTVCRLFTTNGRYGKSATAVVTDGSIFFGLNIPAHKTTEVSEMLRDAEVYEQVNDSKLGIKIYAYEDDKAEVHYSISWRDL